MINYCSDYLMINSIFYNIIKIKKILIVEKIGHLNEESNN